MLMISKKLRLAFKSSQNKLRADGSMTKPALALETLKRGWARERMLLG